MRFYSKNWDLFKIEISPAAGLYTYTYTYTHTNTYTYTYTYIALPRLGGASSFGLPSSEKGWEGLGFIFEII